MVITKLYWYHILCHLGSNHLAADRKSSGVGPAGQEVKVNQQALSDSYTLCLYTLAISLL